jgi:cytochrome c553
MLPPGGAGSVRSLFCIGLFASAFISSDAGFAESVEQVPDTMEVRVTACVSCHGAKGEGTNNPYFPRLAGKPAGYLYNQLLAFKSGRRHYPPMTYLLEYLPEAYLQAMADYFAVQRPPFPPPAVPDVSKDMLAHGEQLVRQGAPDRSIPACVRCHGPTLTGMEPGIPSLLGLRASYISAQLGGWRYGTRTAKAPDCMQIVAGYLTEDDVKAVATYLSSRPAPADLSPAPMDSYKLALACGSEPQ